MLAIRLKRVGRKNDPSFRIIVQDHRRSPKKTRGVAEFVGFYDARKGAPVINAERVKYWMGQGAQPSDTVHNLLVDAKIITGKKVNALNKKTPVIKEVPKEEPKKVAPVAEVKAEEAPVPEVKAEEPVTPPAEPEKAPEVVAEAPAETPAEPAV
ncbi:MAG: 30S ribosomal protein S16 [Parcubacteria group bacterium GW2011_GWA2_47_7]|nr:MAG: 30S ribosomal protein S16 [Parcubacteria group bacterium GW2011_GWA2_47_7]